MSSNAGPSPRSRPRRALTVALGLILIAVLATAAGVGAVSTKQAKSTYGLSTKTNKKGYGKDLAVKRPGRLKYSAGGYQIKVLKLKRFRDWGAEAVEAAADKVKICDTSLPKADRCTTAAGSLGFDLLGPRRCKVGGKKKKVWLYGRTIFNQDPTAAWPTGRGIGFQYGYPDQPAPCPKF